MPDMFYVGQSDFIAKLNELATRIGTQGPQGDPGPATETLSGSGDPNASSPEIGAVGNYYIDEVNSLYYQKQLVGSPPTAIWVQVATIPGTGGGEPVTNINLSDFGSSGSVIVSFEISSSMRNYVLTLDVDPFAGPITDVQIAPYTSDPGTGFIPFNVIITPGLTGNDFSATPFVFQGSPSSVPRTFIGPASASSQELVAQGVVIPPLGAVDILRVYWVGNDGSSSLRTPALVPLRTTSSQFVDVGNTGTGETSIVLADSSNTQTGLFDDGDSFEVYYAGQFVGSSSTKQLRVYAQGNGAPIFDSGALAIAVAATWELRIHAMRRSATEIAMVSTLLVDGKTPQVQYFAFSSGEVTMPCANPLLLTGTAAGAGAATNDIVAKMSKTIDVSRAVGPT